MKPGDSLLSSSYLGAAHQGYIEAQMNAVSRSFAVVVACLEQPLRAQLATAYLLCHVADDPLHEPTFLDVDGVKALETIRSGLGTDQRKGRFGRMDLQRQVRR